MCKSGIPTCDILRVKPLVIFKRKTLPKTANIQKDVLVMAHLKCWMIEDGVKNWLKKVWNVWPGALIKKKSLIVWDMFRAHITDDIKKAVLPLKTYLCIIPGGLKSRHQPLDVSLNKPFKGPPAHTLERLDDIQRNQNNKGRQLPKTRHHLRVSMGEDGMGLQQKWSRNRF